MKKFLKGIVSAALCAVIAVSVCGCGTPSASNPSTSSPLTTSVVEPSSNGTHKVVMTDTGKKLVENGVTAYKIIAPDGGDLNENTAVSEFTYFMKRATGADFDTASATQYNENDKFIVIGKNAYATSAGIEYDRNELKSTGTRIVTKGNSVFIGGAETKGTLNAVYEFLSRTVGFEIYTKDVIVINESATVPLYAYDITEVPDFEFRQLGYGSVNNDELYFSRMRGDHAEQVFATVKTSLWHNSFEIVDKNTYGENLDWYSNDGKQLCYTAHGIKAEYDAMVETASGILFNALMASKKSNGVGFMHEDNSAWCGCEKCSAIKTEYGADSATAIMFVNDLAEATNAKLRAAGDEREITYWLFAYLATTNAPVKKTADGAYVSAGDAVDMRKNKLGIVYAPILMDYTKTMEDVSNVAYADIIKQWGALTDDVFFWGYDTVFSNYFAFQNTFGSIQTNLQTAANNNVSTVMLQGQYDTRNGTCFTNFKVYLTAKLEWDVNENYDKLFNDFFDNYFKAASETMKQLFRLHTTHFAWFANEYNVFCQGANDTVVAKYYPKGTVNTFMALIEQAYKDIEGLRSSDPVMYEKLYDRITLESLAYRYMLISLYSSNYLDSELDAMKTSFRSDCGMLGMTNYKEHSTIDGLWASWGM